jgi:glycosyltransferase involved in cell wall biosynthesis
VRVLFDATSVPANRGGVGRYVEEVVRELARDHVELVVVAKRGDLERFAHIAGPRARYLAAPRLVDHTWGRFAWEQTGLPALARRVRADVVHSPHYTFPVLTRRARVVTLHDATFFSDPHVHSQVKGVFFRFWTRRALRHADVCITPSEATAKELERAGLHRRAHLRVAHLGIDHEAFRPPTDDELERVRDAIGIGEGGWVAFLGTLEPRKNVPALVRAMATIAQKRGRDRTPALVLAGARGWDDALDATVEDAMRHVDIVRAGYVDVHLLPALLGGSELTVYPSLGEGFGLPVLEAMASGAAVLTTTRLALPEIGGDAVAYTEPDDDSIRRAIETLLDDAPQRTELRRKAIARAAGFTWRRTADEHLAAYALALRGRR